MSVVNLVPANGSPSLTNAAMADWLREQADIIEKDDIPVHITHLTVAYDDGDIQHGFTADQTVRTTEIIGLMQWNIMQLWQRSGDSD